MLLYILSERVSITAYIAENTEEKYGLLFVGSCGVVGALAMLAIVVLDARRRR